MSNKTDYGYVEVLDSNTERVSANIYVRRRGDHGDMLVAQHLSVRSLRLVATVGFDQFDGRRLSQEPVVAFISNDDDSLVVQDLTEWHP